MRFSPFFLSLSLILFLPFAQAKLPLIGKVPDFVFQDQNGNEFKNSNLNGNVWIANFVFTRCQGQCPLISRRMKELEKELANTGVKFVSFSVDPEHDKSAILSKYAKDLEAKEGSWFFLTGEKELMWDFIQVGFKLGVAEPTAEDLKNGAEPVMHSSKFVLVDQEGQIAGYYDTSETIQMEQLINDAKNLSGN